MANEYISDALMAAFLEGNVNGSEMAKVLRAIKTDEDLREALGIALQLENDELPQMQIAAESGRNLCDIECESYVLNSKGISCSIEQLLEVAKEKRWIRKAGTPLYCIGKLLEHKGLGVVRKYNSTIEDVRKRLGAGCAVIVAVDSDKLYPERPDEEDATNHAVVLTGITSDAVTIYDPGNKTKVDINLQLFISAWKESDCYMVSTSVRPPHSKKMNAR